MKDKIVIENRNAHFNYILLDEYTAGIVLTGCEVKSVRNADINMSDSYCVIDGNEMIIKNLHISQYVNSYGEYDPKRDRKLLLKKHEIQKIHQNTKTKGMTVVPLKMYTNDRGLVKVTVALAKGKHTYDKSESIKERDLNRELKSL